MVIVRIVIFILFITFAVVQINDPDPWLWVIMYAYVAVMAALGHFMIRTKWFILSGILVAAIWLGTLMPDFVHWIKMGAPSIVESMQATQPHIELVREFLGLVLILIALYILYRLDRRSDF